MRTNQRFPKYVITRSILLVNLLCLIVVGGACNAKPTAVLSPTAPSVLQIEYVGRVLSQDTNSPVSNAKVTLDFQGAPPIVYTDSEGVYRFTINAESSKVSGRVRVDANNYEKYDRNITLYTNLMTIEDIRLVPVPTLALTQPPMHTNVPSTPTATPTEVLQPMPTSTNTPPPTPICPAVNAPFTNVWNSVREKIGCPSGSIVSGLVAEERFERGMMFWREPIDYAQALVLFNNGSWQIYQHSPYAEGSPEFSCLDANTPAQCPPTPKRGFGMMWCDIPEIRSGLGNALECERSYQASMQRFERGFMLQTDNGVIYIYYDNGQWENR